MLEYRNKRRNRERKEYTTSLKRTRRMQHRKESGKRVLSFVIGVLGILGVAMIVISILHRNPIGNELGQLTEMSETTELNQAIAQITNLSGTEEVLQNTEEGNEGITNEQIMDENSQTEPQIYTFTSTPDTVTISNEEIISSNIILVDESTDTIIAQRGAMERISPASMTKVLTILVAAEHISPENLDDTFTVTFEATDYAYVNDCSCAGFEKDEVVTVRDLFYGTILPSGGDAAVALAMYIAGSHEAFVDMMNAKLEELGLGDTAHFTNCVGIYNENHYCTVYDMAVIMKAALQNELCKEVLSTRCYTTSFTEQHPEGLVLSNWFIRRIEDKDNESGGEVLGGKTGYVVQSKSCAVSYGIFAGGTPYICVAAGSSSSWRCIYDHVDIYTQYVPKASE